MIDGTFPFNNEWKSFEECFSLDEVAYGVYSTNARNMTFGESKFGESQRNLSSEGIAFQDLCFH